MRCTRSGIMRSDTPNLAPFFLHFTANVQGNSVVYFHESQFAINKHKSLLQRQQLQQKKESICSPFYIDSMRSHYFGKSSQTAPFVFMWPAIHVASSP